MFRVSKVEKSSQDLRQKDAAYYIWREINWYKLLNEKVDEDCKSKYVI